ncbi:MAG: GNAT family N-acetyltransferase [Segetibacter sp.]
MCIFKKEDEQLYLGMLTVAPELQGNGIGKMIMQASEEKAKQLGCKSIVMTVITYRHELINWYKRHGYYETGQKQPFPTDEKFGMPKVPLEFLVMEKIIVK